MKAHRFLAVTRRIFLDLRNDRRMPALIFLAPVFAMFALGYAAAFSVVGIIQSSVLPVIGIPAFHIIIAGNVLLALAVIALLAVASQAPGILPSSLARRESQAIQFVPFVLLSMFLFTGIFRPLEAIPSWLRPFSYLVPPTHAVQACRSVMLKGWGIGRIGVDVAALPCFAAVFLTLAVASLKVRKD